MIRNYIKIALRNLLKSKLHSTINILGLAIGLAAVILISLYVQDEMSYDKFHQNADDIYRIAWWSDNPQTRTPHPMAQALVQDFPQVESAVSLSPLWGPGLTKQVFSVRNPENNITFDESGILGVDSTFFNVFSFKLLKGNEDEVLRNVGGLLISESTAAKYFGEEDPIGKFLAINDDETLVFVEGVFEDVPDNSHFHFDALISYVTQKAIEDDESAYYTWADFGHFNYVRLKSGSDPDLLQRQLMEWVLNYIEISQEEIERALGAGVHFKLQPITDIHLESRIRWELEPNGNKDYVYIMLAAAVLILIIACTNFMNLSTARSTERAKEIGVRKSLGAFKGQVGIQFLGESLLTATLAMVIAGLLVEMFLPLFNYITHKQLDIKYFEQPQLVGIFLGCTLFTGLIAGLYPSVFLSSMHPVASLKGIGKLKPKGATLRKSLIVFQFVMSMILLSGSLVIYNQLQFVRTKDLGFKSESVVVIPFKNYGLLRDFETIKTKLQTIAGVTSVSATSNLPGKQFNQEAIYAVQDDQNRVNASQTAVDFDFFHTLGIDFVSGRGFSKNFPTDSMAFVINESAAKGLMLEDPIGQEIFWDWDDGQPPMRGTIIGVVKDFNYNSLHEPIRPLLFYLSPGFNDVVLKLETNDINTVMASVESVWRKFEDRFGFEYSILSSDIQNQYISEERTAKVFGGFSFLAIAIACFGLFAIASINFTYRTKEVGIRKVMGASSFKILSTLLKDFVNLIVLSIIIAMPVAWLTMEQWLSDFTYRIDLSFDSFLVAALALVAIALITLSYLTINTANSNPIDSLKED